MNTDSLPKTLEQWLSHCEQLHPKGIQGIELGLDRLRSVAGRMHGGSGVSDDDYRRAIDAGIRKINYYTYGVKYAGEAVQQVIADFKSKNADANVYWHDMTMAAYQRLYEDFTSVIKVFANGSGPLA